MKTKPTKELLAVGAFLASMHDHGLDGAKVREAMLQAMGLDGAAQAEAESLNADLF